MVKKKQILNFRNYSALRIKHEFHELITVIQRISVISTKVRQIISANS